ncbi:hypothetical protein D3D01_18915 [Haloarcula sp. Atlit-7R]|nr:hypothetical protein D3D01_18915 [Haloarcula sp. Atlit-7R]
MMSLYFWIILMQIRQSLPPITVMRLANMGSTDTLQTFRSLVWLMCPGTGQLQTTPAIMTLDQVEKIEKILLPTT